MADVKTLKSRGQLEADIKALIKWFNRAEDGTMVVPAEYLQVVIEKPEFSKEM
jgi:hypothetical protein